MHCKNCGVEFDNQANFCSGCGTKAGEGNSFCSSCGTKVLDDDIVCSSCGNSIERNYTREEPKSEPQTVYYESTYNSGQNQGYSNQTYNNQYQNYNGKQPKSKIVAGVLGILLGSLGIHRFYLGYIGIGVLQLVLTFITCGISSIWGFIEGILILCGSGITTDADGIPLSDK